MNIINGMWQKRMRKREGERFTENLPLLAQVFCFLFIAWLLFIFVALPSVCGANSFEKRVPAAFAPYNWIRSYCGPSLIYLRIAHVGRDNRAKFSIVCSFSFFTFPICAVHHRNMSKTNWVNTISMCYSERCVLRVWWITQTTCILQFFSLLFQQH